MMTGQTRSQSTAHPVSDRIDGPIQSTTGPQSARRAPYPIVLAVNDRAVACCVHHVTG